MPSLESREENIPVGARAMDMLVTSKVQYDIVVGRWPGLEVAIVRTKAIITEAV